MNYYDPAGACYVCGDPNARRYVNGRFCPAHHVTPPEPDPTRTMVALMAAAGRTGPVSFGRSGSDILKERTGGYVSRHGPNARQRAIRAGLK